MNFSQAVISGFKNYSTFSGRASRSEFWYFGLFLVVADVVLLLLDMAVFNISYSDDKLHPFGDFFLLATWLPSLAVTARRLHDVNRSGWWILIIFTIIGMIPMIIWNCMKGTEGENRFGPDSLA